MRNSNSGVDINLWLSVGNKKPEHFCAVTGCLPQGTFMITCPAVLTLMSWLWKTFRSYLFNAMMSTEYCIISVDTIESLIRATSRK